MSDDFGTSDKLTLIVVPDETSRVRRFQISKQWLKYAMWAAPALGLALLLLFGDYVRLRVDAVDVDRLSEEARARQVRVDALAASVGGLEEQLDRIRELERKIRVIADLPEAPEDESMIANGGQRPSLQPAPAEPPPPAPARKQRSKTRTVEKQTPPPASKAKPSKPKSTLPAKRDREAPARKVAPAKPPIELKMRKPAPAKPRAPAQSRRGEDLGVPLPGEKPPAHMIIPENQNPPPPPPAKPVLPGFNPNPDPEAPLLGDPEQDAGLEEIERILGGMGTTSYLAEKSAQLSAILTVREESLEALLKSLRGKSARLAATPSIWPTKGWVTSAYGPRTSPFTGRRQFHAGLDIAANFGTPIIAPADGRVIFVGSRGPMGKTVEIDHGHKTRTVYAHLDEYFVKKGERVTRGQTIAEMGSTGRSTGPHLHYAIKIEGKSINPANYILD